MIQKMMETIKSKYTCKSVDAGVFAKVVIQGANFKIDAYDVVGVGRVATVQMKRLIGFWEMQSLIITPYEKDMPIYYHNRHREKGNYIYRLELFDTQFNAVDLADLKNVIEKHSALPEEPQKERWYDNRKLLSTVKKVPKRDKENLDPVIWECFETYMKLLDKAADCKKIEKKKKATVFVNDLIKRSGLAIVEIFISIYGEQVTAKLCNEVLFGLE